MSQTPQQPTNVTTQQVSKEQPKPTGYRVEQEKRIQINRSHTQRRQRAEVLKVLSIGLFGRRRYTNMYLVSSLNNFYHALMIANTLQKRVQRVALVINMQKVKYTEFQAQGAQGVSKQYSIFVIKITRQPTEEDKKNPGFNPGSQKIENPLTEVITFRRIQRGGRGDDRRGGQRRGGQRRGNDRRGNDRRRDDRRGDRRDDRRDDRRQDRRTTQRRTERREDRREDRQQNRRQNRPVDNRRGGERQGRNQQRRQNNNRSYVKRQQRRDDRGTTNERRNYRQRNDQDFDRRPRRVRQDPHERVEQDGLRRGQRQRRGNNTRPVQQGGRVAEHEYKPQHLNRGGNQRKQNVRRQDDRRDRAPKRNRYSSDEEY